MINNFILASNLETIGNKFHFQLGDHTIPIKPNFRVGINSLTYVVTCENPHEIQTMRFGYTPHWSKRPVDILNARAEGDKNPFDDPCYDGARAIFQTNAFKHSIRLKRCLVVADAFYVQNSQNKPYLVYLKDKVRPFGFAGVYDLWLNPLTNQIQTGFAIITTTANELLWNLGVKRMPVILPLGRENDWLKVDRPLSKVLGMLNEYSSEKMNAYPVSNLIIDSEVNDKSLIQPIGDKLQQIVSPQPVQPRQYWQSKEGKKNRLDIPWSARIT